MIPTWTGIGASVFCVVNWSSKFPSLNMKWARGNYCTSTLLPEWPEFNVKVLFTNFTEIWGGIHKKVSLSAKKERFNLCSDDGKVNQMISPDLEFRPKNRIFDLDSLTDIESKKFWSKSWRQKSKSETSKSKIFPFDDPK